MHNAIQRRSRCSKSEILRSAFQLYGNVIMCKHDIKIEIYIAIIEKDYSDLSSRHQRRRKAEIRNDIQKYVSDPLFSIGLTVETVQLKDINTNNSFQIRVSNNASQQESTGEVIEEGAHIPEICYLLLKYGVAILEILS